MEGWRWFAKLVCGMCHAVLNGGCMPSCPTCVACSLIRRRPLTRPTFPSPCGVRLRSVRGERAACGDRREARAVTATKQQPNEGTNGIILPLGLARSLPCMSLLAGGQDTQDAHHPPRHMHATGALTLHPPNPGSARSRDWAAEARGGRFHTHSEGQPSVSLTPPSLSPSVHHTGGRPPRRGGRKGAAAATSSSHSSQQQQ